MVNIKIGLATDSMTFTPTATYQADNGYDYAFQNGNPFTDIVEKGSYDISEGFTYGSSARTNTLKFNLSGSMAQIKAIEQYSHIVVYKDGVLAFSGCRPTFSKKIDKGVGASGTSESYVESSVSFEDYSVRLKDVTFSSDETFDLYYTSQDGIKVCNPNDTTHSLVHILFSYLDKNNEFTLHFGVIPSILKTTTVSYFSATFQDKVLSVLSDVLKQAGLAYYVSKTDIYVLDILEELDGIATNIPNIESGATKKGRSFIKLNIPEIRMATARIVENVKIFDSSEMTVKSKMWSWDPDKYYPEDGSYAEGSYSCEKKDDKHPNGKDEDEKEKRYFNFRDVHFYGDTSIFTGNGAYLDYFSRNATGVKYRIKNTSIIDRKFRLSLNADVLLFKYITGFKPTTEWDGSKDECDYIFSPEMAQRYANALMYQKKTEATYYEFYSDATESYPNGYPINSVVTLQGTDESNPLLLIVSRSDKLDPFGGFSYKAVPYDRTGVAISRSYVASKEELPPTDESFQLSASREVVECFADRTPKDTSDIRITVTIKNRLLSPTLTIADETATMKREKAAVTGTTEYADTDNWIYDINPNLNGYDTCKIVVTVGSESRGLTISKVIDSPSTDFNMIAPDGYEVVTQYAFGEKGKGPTRWLADGNLTDQDAVVDADDFLTDMWWVDEASDGTCPLRPRTGCEIWKRQGIRIQGSTAEPTTWNLTLHKVSQAFSFSSRQYVFERNTRDLEGDGYSTVGLIIDIENHYGTLTLVTSAGYIGVVVNGVVSQLGASVQIEIPALSKVHLDNYLVMLPNTSTAKQVSVQALIGDISSPTAYASIVLGVKEEATWSYLGIFTEAEIEEYGTGGPTDSTGEIKLGKYAGKQVVDGDLFVISGINALNVEYLDIKTFINGGWDFLSSHEDDDEDYDKKLLTLAPEVYSGNVDSKLLPQSFSFIENLVSKHVTAEFIGAKRIKLLSSTDKLGAIYAGEIDWTKENGKRVTSAKGFVLDGNGDAEIKNLDVAGNSFIHGNCTVGGTIANKVKDTNESVFFTNKDTDSGISWETSRNSETEAVSKQNLLSLLASLCSGQFLPASGSVNPKGNQQYSVHGVFMHPTSGTAASFSRSYNCARNHDYSDPIEFNIPDYMPQSFFVVSWTAKWTDSNNLVGAREVNRGSVTYSITNTRTGKNQSGTLMYSDDAGGWIGKPSLSVSGSTTLVLEGGDKLTLQFSGRGYAYSISHNGEGSGSASVSYAASNYSSDGARDITPVGVSNHVRGILYFVVDTSQGRVALSFNYEEETGTRDLLGKSFFELRDMGQNTYDTSSYSAPFPFTSGLQINSATVDLSNLTKYYKIVTPTFSGQGTISSASLKVVQNTHVYYNNNSDYHDVEDIAVVTMQAGSVKIALNNTNTIEMTTAGYYQIGAGFYIHIETLTSKKGAFSQNLMPIFEHDSQGQSGSRVGQAAGWVGNDTEPWYKGVAEQGWVQGSARKLKEDIEVFRGSALELLRDVCIYSFHYKSDRESPDRYTHYGFIADDTCEELSTPKHNIMETGNCIGLIIKGMQELMAEINKLKENSK